MRLRLFLWAAALCLTTALPAAQNSGWISGALRFTPGASTPAEVAARESQAVEFATEDSAHFTGAALRRSASRSAAFAGTELAWSLDGAYEAHFDSLVPQRFGAYTVGAVWRTAHRIRLKSEDTLLLENGLEKQFSMSWFSAQPLHSELLRNSDGDELVAAGPVTGRRWTLSYVLVPCPEDVGTVRSLPTAGAASAVQVERPGSTELIAASFEPGMHKYGRVATNAEALLVQCGRAFASPIRIRYFQGDRLKLATGIAPAAISGAAQWKFSDGAVEMVLKQPSGEIEIHFPNLARTTVNLNRDWKYLYLDAPPASQPAYDDSYWATVQIPHAVVAPDQDKPAVAWYRKRFTVPPEQNGKRTWLNFDGVAAKSEVWLNGQHLGERLDAFNSFGYDVTPYLNPPGRPNLLAVRVAYGTGLRFSFPYNPEGYNNYGGIYRDVSLVYTDPLHLESITITTPDVSARSATVSVCAVVADQGRALRSARLVSIIYDAGQREIARMASAVSLAPDGSREFAQTYKPIASPHLWSPDSPYLYTLVSRLESGGVVLDEQRQPLGFRWYSFDPVRGFFLNGKHLKLHGVNMHQGYPYLGNAVPDSKQPHDLHVLKRMGVNFLRTTHTPTDPLVLDLADRLGLLVWEEVPIDSAFRRSADKPAYAAVARRQLRDMIRRDHKHPSIILWSLMNEVTIGSPGGQFPEAVALCHDLAEIAKQEDPTRPTAIAEMPNANFGCTDIDGRNQYFRGRSLYNLAPTLDALEAGHPRLPTIISEYGAPNTQRANFGNAHDNTEEYIAFNHEQYVREYERRPWIAGYTIWTAFDYARGNPHEGIMDEARYPKDVYYFYQSQWSAEPMLKIRSSAHWNFPVNRYMDSRVDDTHDVIVDSNCDSVELFVNGRSQGVKKGAGPFAWRQVAFVPGVLRAVGRRGSVIVEDVRETAGDPARVALTADVDEVAADGADVAFLTARLVDAQDRLEANSYGPVTFSVEGCGELVSPPVQEFLGGIATLGVVRAPAVPCKIRVTAAFGERTAGDGKYQSGIALGAVVIGAVTSKSSTDHE